MWLHITNKCACILIHVVSGILLIEIVQIKDLRWALLVRIKAQSKPNAGGHKSLVLAHECHLSAIRHSLLTIGRDQPIYRHAPVSPYNHRPGEGVFWPLESLMIFATAGVQVSFPGSQQQSGAAQICAAKTGGADPFPWGGIATVPALCWIHHRHSCLPHKIGLGCLWIHLFMKLYVVLCSGSQKYT